MGVVSGPSGRRRWNYDELGLAYCSLCRLWKQSEMFSPSGPGSARSYPHFYPYCRPCRTDYLSGQAPGEPPGWSRARVASVRKKYRLTPSEWELIFERQGRRCPICWTTEPGPRGWVVDHDHECCPGSQTCGNCIVMVACSLCNLAEGIMSALVRRGGREAAGRLADRMMNPQRLPRHRDPC